VNTNAKVLIVGLDAMEADLVGKWTDSGELPTLAKLRREGVSGRASSLPGLGSDVIWTSFLTHTSNIFFAACGASIASDQLNAPVEVMDFAPTVADILAVDPADWDGTTIAGLLDRR
jgi:predicted AlkP superfamily phosphohydrolase/phosphomutase